MQSDVEKIVGLIGEDQIQPLGDGLYRIKREQITLAKNGMRIDESGNFSFGNPRWHTIDGKPVAEGLTAEEMLDLRNSIKDEGLIDPVRLRIHEDGRVETINGERRIRCIDGLVQSDENVYDIGSRTHRPASEVHEWISCRIEFMTDEEAIRAAMRPNDTGRRIGEIASLSVVKTLSEAGYSSEKIAELIGRSISWTNQSLNISSDPILSKAFESKEINRSVAISLLEIEDTDRRIARLDELRQVVEQRIQKQFSEIDDKIAKTEIAEEHLEGQLAIAQAIGESEDVIKGIQDNVDQLHRTRERHEQNRERVGQRQITGRDAGNRKFSITKIDKVWRRQLQVLITDENLEIRNRAQVALDVLNAIRDSSKDPDDPSKPIPVEMIICSESFEETMID